MLIIISPFVFLSCPSYPHSPLEGYHTTDLEFQENQGRIPSLHLHMNYSWSSNLAEALSSARSAQIGTAAVSNMRYARAPSVPHNYDHHMPTFELLLTSAV